MIHSVSMASTDKQNPQFLRTHYSYDLPEELIASRPSQRRDGCRLLVYERNKDKVTHAKFDQIQDFLPSKAHLVLNQSKVFPCRLLGHKESGGKVEVFLLSLIKKDSGYPVLIKTSRKKKVGDSYQFGQVRGVITKQNEDGSFVMEFFGEQDFLSFLQDYAKIPIPPYIRGGEADEKDKQDYQTVYAQKVGSVAAPTAGLHFTPELLEKIPHSMVTLHVGAGTFLPVKTDDIREHKMHSEYYEVDKDNWHSILKNQDNLIAVGTTSLRVLESLWKERECYQNDLRTTDIFIYPGKKVESIKGLLTNFHLPESTLLMLVSALIGRDKTLELYQEAVKEKYRFFSYGDAMLII